MHLHITENHTIRALQNFLVPLKTSHPLRTRILAAANGIKVVIPRKAFNVQFAKNCSAVDLASKHVRTITEASKNFDAMAAVAIQTGE